MKKILFIVLVLSLTVLSSCKKNKPEPTSFDITSITAKMVGDQLEVVVTYPYPGSLTNLYIFLCLDGAENAFAADRDGDNFYTYISNPESYQNVIGGIKGSVYLRFYNYLYTCHTNDIDFEYSF